MVQYEPEPALDYDFTEWQTMLCHSRCADFMAVKIREMRAIDSILTWLARKLKDGEESDNAEAREKARKALVARTRSICTAITKYYRKPPAWEPDLADAILKAPQNWLKVIDYFETQQTNTI